MVETDIIKMLEDTTLLIQQKQGQNLSKILMAAQSVNTTNQMVNNVEFWNWLGNNYRNDFGSVSAAQRALLEKSDWAKTILQGKGYEWDWMNSQRSSFGKIFSRFNAGDRPTQPGIDVTETSIISKRTLGTYQNKAYVSSNVPNLHNTPKDAVVVTNSEKVAYAQGQGYNVQEFMGNTEIISERDKRAVQAIKGKAEGQYNIRNVGMTMAKAGAMGCVIGLTTEAVVYYKQWENGELTDEKYLEHIVEAGGNAGVTAGATAGIMVPISSAITVAGMSNIITLPIAIVVSASIDKIVAPCFKRGLYSKYLNKAHYYQNMEIMYEDFLCAIDNAAKHYETYLTEMRKQDEKFSMLKKLDQNVTEDLKALYESI